ncbi:hypothetical protein CC80DRAFT_489176 [Byssothecium circinans]|uniref:LDB19 N-terminal domain-containing protein n=1 Tax=Byssothecium circinans TaxID=147558 RepID=A0A6A5U8E3_9PLEO|nr:hypothetical protein CC80DRAFT_489176 [Byssothecium circinans]
MPGRLLSLVRPAPASSPLPTLHVKAKKPTPTPSVDGQREQLDLPPHYSVERPSNPRTKSQDSLVMEAFKRHSLGTLSHSDKKSPKGTPKSTPKGTPKGSPKGSPKIEPRGAAIMNMKMESPPLVFYNTPEESSGALLSGLLTIDVRDPYITLDKFDMRLLAIVSTKKPVHAHCPECTNQITEIKHWKFIEAPVSLRHGKDHSYPFSTILAGSLPATTRCQLATLDYYLDAVATMSNGKTITYKRNLDVKRAIFPGNERHSIRIFPPTNLTASVKLPPVIHPIGDFPVEMRLSGIAQNNDQAQTRWRLRKLNWRIEELTTFVAPACPKHAQKIGGEGKGIEHHDSRTIAGEEVKTEWKTDFDAGHIEAEFRVACNMALKPLCDVNTAGLNIKHNLIIEMVVAEEWAQLKRLQQATPTGAARVLRTQFHIIVTERSGMGIAWDEEQPPLYDNVPASPPNYNSATTIHDYDASSLSDETEHLRI